MFVCMLPFFSATAEPFALKLGMVFWNGTGKTAKHFGVHWMRNYRVIAWFMPNRRAQDCLESDWRYWRQIKIIMRGQRIATMLYLTSQRLLVSMVLSNGIRASQTLVKSTWDGRRNGRRKHWSNQPEIRFLLRAQVCWMRAGLSSVECRYRVMGHSYTPKHRF